MGKPDWNNGVIESRTWDSMRGAWAFAVFWILCTSPVLFFIEGMWKREGTGIIGILAFLILPLSGIALVLRAVKLTKQWKCFGRITLTMNPFPGSIDGEIGGEVTIEMPYDPNIIYEVSLSCIYSHKERSFDGDYNRRENLIWHETGYGKSEPRAKGHVVQFLFETSADLPLTDKQDKSNYHLWRVTIQADSPRGPLYQVFEIPVIAIGGRSAGLQTNSAEYFPQGDSSRAVEQLLPLTRTGNLTQFYYPMFRNLPRNLILIFGAIGAVILLLFLWSEITIFGLFAFPYYVAFSLVILVCFIVVLWVLYGVFNSLEVILDGRYLRTKRRVLGMTLRSKAVPYEEITEIKIEKGTVFKSEDEIEMDYHIQAHSADKTLVLAEFIRAPRQATMVKEYFEEILAVDNSSA